MSAGDPVRARYIARAEEHAARYAAAGNESMARHYRNRAAELRRLDGLKAKSFPASFRL